MIVAFTNLSSGDGGTAVVAMFFGREVFTFAVKYFPIDQVDDAMKIVTSGK